MFALDTFVNALDSCFLMGEVPRATTFQILQIHTLNIKHQPGGKMKHQLARIYLRYGDKTFE